MAMNNLAYTEMRSTMKYNEQLALSILDWKITAESQRAQRKRRDSSRTRKDEVSILRSRMIKSYCLGLLIQEEVVVEIRSSLPHPFLYY